MLKTDVATGCDVWFLSHDDGVSTFVMNTSLAFRRFFVGEKNEGITASCICMCGCACVLNEETVFIVSFIPYGAVSRVGARP